MSASSANNHQVPTRAHGTEMFHPLASSGAKARPTRESSTNFGHDGGPASTVVRKTTQRKRAPAEAWVCFDRDEHPCWANAIDHVKPRLAASNASIELFGLLIHGDQAAPIHLKAARPQLKVLNRRTLRATSASVSDMETCASLHSLHIDLQRCHSQLPSEVESLNGHNVPPERSQS